MSSGYLELFWTLLELSKFDELRSSIPKNFSWNIVSPEKGKAVLVAACNFPIGDSSNEKKTLDMIEWLIKAGASLSQKCGETEYYCSLRIEDEKDSLRVDYKGHTIMSYINAWLQEFDNKPEWKREVDFLTRVVERIAKATSQLQARPRASVDEGIVEIWEKFLHATTSHDLTIEAADCCVTAHAQMLMEASPVVQAMLGSPMKECQTQRIQLKDTSSGAVTLFLEALYTCSSQGVPDYNTALSALDLAHRWQVEAVVAILADLIEGLITEESFASIAEHAALKGLDTLKKACQNFGSQNAAIQERIGKSQFPKVVQDLFSDKATSQPLKKRKRL